MAHRSLRQRCDAGLPWPQDGPQCRRRPRQSVAQARVAQAGNSRIDPMYLATKRVKPATQPYYKVAHNEVLAYARTRKLTFHSPAARDKLLNQYLHYRFFAGEAIFAARTAVYGFAFWEHVNLRDPSELAMTRLTPKGFEKTSPGDQHDPLPWEALLLIVGFLFGRLQGYDGPIAQFLLLAFDGYARVSELLGLRGKDITVIKTRLLSACPLVTITICPQVSGDDSGTFGLPRAASMTTRSPSETCPRANQGADVLPTCFEA